jgi:hypothetical protein
MFCWIIDLKQMMLKTFNEWANRERVFISLILNVLRKIWTK